MESFDPDAVAILNAITDRSSAKIIFISNRRNWLDFEDLKTVFKRAGISGEMIGITPYLRGHHRGDEIQEWFDNNECDSYVIIDDIEDFPTFKDKWVEVDNCEGLVESHIEKALSLLRPSTEQ